MVDISYNLFIKVLIVKYGLKVYIIWLIWFLILVINKIYNYFWVYVFNGICKYGCLNILILMYCSFNRGVEICFY